MRRVLAFTAVVVLVALAGCQAPGMGGPGDGLTASPTGDASDGELGQENGYAYDANISVTPDDGLNETELNATVSRAMARVERVRGLEFEHSVPVEVINRSTYRNESGGNHSEALRQFDNAKFEALFLVGEDEGSIDEQEENRGSTVAGYYSPGREAIVIVSEADNPTLSSEQTLAHELVHALQDQHFGLGNLSAETRDAYAGQAGLVEGDASFTERRYMANCGEEWDCISATQTGPGGSGGDVHLGLYILQYFPYSEGPTFVEALYERGSWEAVNDAYDEVPDSATEIIEAEQYPDWEPANVSVDAGAVGGEWDLVEPPNRTNRGRLGQSAITAGAAYTLYDDVNQTAVVRPRTFLNLRPNGTVDPQRPFNYDIGPADGWAGDTFLAFENGDGDLAYAWRSEWDSAGEASEFRDTWTDLIAHWGGQQVAENTYVIEDGSYADAFRVTVEGATVTVVNAPERSDLSAFGDV